MTEPTGVGMSLEAWGAGKWELEFFVREKGHFKSVVLTWGELLQLRALIEHRATTAVEEWQLG